jgi:hypothetical protein
LPVFASVVVRDATFVLPKMNDPPVAAVAVPVAATASAM